MQSGRLQSKVMRDVEAIETLSQQLFVNMMTIALNVIVAVTVTGTKSALVLVFLYYVRLRLHLQWLHSENE